MAWPKQHKMTGFVFGRNACCLLLKTISWARKSPSMWHLCFSPKSLKSEAPSNCRRIPPKMLPSIVSAALFSPASFCIQDQGSLCHASLLLRQELGRLLQTGDVRKLGNRFAGFRSGAIWGVKITRPNLEWWFLTEVSDDFNENTVVETVSGIRRLIKAMVSGELQKPMGFSIAQSGMIWQHLNHSRLQVFKQEWTFDVYQYRYLYLYVSNDLWSMK